MDSKAETLNQVEVDVSGAVYGIDSSGNVVQRQPDGTWASATSAPVGLYSYYGSSNAVQSAAATEAYDELTTIANAFAAGSANVQPAGQAMQAVLASIAAGTASTLQIGLSNGLDWLSWERRRSELRGGDSGGTDALSGVAALIGGLIITGGESRIRSR